MVMPPRLRKSVVTAHLAFAVGWIGALTGFLALAVVGLVSQDAGTVRAAYIANELVTWYVILPFAFSALLTGILQALTTPWGLARNYWVLFKLVIVSAAAIMLTGKLGGISHLAEVAAEGTLSGDDLLGLRYSVLGHAIGGLAVLLWAAALGVFKPRGLTGYGRRRQNKELLRPRS